MNIAGIIFAGFVLAVTVGVFWACHLLDEREARELAEICSREMRGLRPPAVIVSPAGVEIPVGSLSSREIVAALAEIDRLTGAVTA